MQRCLARLYYFIRIGDRVRKIRTDITPYSHSSGLPLLFFSVTVHIRVLLAVSRFVVEKILFKIEYALKNEIRIYR
jgi:hypothetical protein